MSLTPQTTFYLRRRRRRAAQSVRLLLVPLIDVVFLLLVFFLLTANFRAREGFLPADLPRRSVPSRQIELEPLLIRLGTLADGRCQVQIGSELPFVVETDAGEGVGFTMLTKQVAEVLRQQGRTGDDPVKIMPARQTRWGHVAKAYDALWQLNLNNIIFTMVE